jgi:omega-6 fatty acid desaturase (delta-12 desaturase)
MATNAGIAVLVVATMWMVGVGPFLLVHLPITLLASSIGVWLFYVQHQFEDTFWEKAPAWTHHDAALHGSSHYDLPHVLRWFTANIGVHHVHHLCSRIPYYRLTLLDSLGCVRLVLWDETCRRLISFRELRRRFKSR